MEIYERIVDKIIKIHKDSLEEILLAIRNLNLFEDEKISFNPSQIQITSNELKDDSNIIEIDILSEKNKNILVGLNGILCLKTEYSDLKSNLFDPETIEQDTSFEPGMNFH